LVTKASSGDLTIKNVPKDLSKKYKNVQTKLNNAMKKAKKLKAKYSKK